MKKTLKREQILELHGMIKMLIEKSPYGILDRRLVFALHKNFDNLKGEVEAIIEAQKPSEKYLVYQKEKEELGKRFSDKDEQGNPKTKLVEGMELFIIEEQKEKASQAMIELNTKYSEAINKRKEEIKQFEQVIQEDAEVELCLVSFKYFPEKYDPNDHIILKHIIKESDKEIEETLLS